MKKFIEKFISTFIAVMVGIRSSYYDNGMSLLALFFIVLIIYDYITRCKSIKEEKLKVGKFYLLAIFFNLVAAVIFLLYPQFQKYEVISLISVAIADVAIIEVGNRIQKRKTRN